MDGVTHPAAHAARLAGEIASRHGCGALEHYRNQLPPWNPTMRCIITTICLFATALPCHAQGAKTNTLTAQEIADGWISLFDGDTTFGWDIAGPATVAEG